MSSESPSLPEAGGVYKTVTSKPGARGSTLTCSSSARNATGGRFLLSQQHRERRHVLELGFLQYSTTLLLAAKIEEHVSLPYRGMRTVDPRLPLMNRPLPHHVVRGKQHAKGCYRKQNGPEPCDLPGVCFRRWLPCGSCLGSGAAALSETQVCLIPAHFPCHSWLDSV